MDLQPTGLCVSARRALPQHPGVVRGLRAPAPSTAPWPLRERPLSVCFSYFWNPSHRAFLGFLAPQRKGRERRRKENPPCPPQPFCSPPQRRRGRGTTPSRSGISAALPRRRRSRRGARGLRTPALRVSRRRAAAARGVVGVGERAERLIFLSPLPKGFPGAPPRRNPSSRGRESGGQPEPSVCAAAQGRTWEQTGVRGEVPRECERESVVRLGAPERAHADADLRGSGFPQRPLAERPTRAASSVS